LLAASGGSGGYAIRQDGFIQIFLFAICGFFCLGLVINYFELNKMKIDLEEISDG
jgi:hypothetical protein